MDLVHCGLLSQARLRRHAKSPQPMRVCGLAWNSGGARSSSVAVGLHDVLGVGELVELVDVGLGNHDVDGGEHSGLLVGSCIQWCVPAWRGRGSPGGSRARSKPTRVASARPCVSNKKSAGPAWQLRQALDGYSLSLPKCSINRLASNLDRTKNQAIAKQSGCVHTIHTNVRRPSQFRCCLGCDRLQITNFISFDVGSREFINRCCA